MLDDNDEWTVGKVVFLVSLLVFVVGAFGLALFHSA